MKLPVAVLALALVVVVAAGSAAAGSLITSAQIKDRTIKIRDLSRPTVKRLERIEPVEVRWATGGAEVSPGARAAALAICPEGTNVTGVGIVNRAPDLEWVDQVFMPVSNAGSIAMFNPTSEPLGFSILATCVKSKLRR
ncbi:MAG TPA: hypothetical protein VD790_10195 [Thermoleophilaceae bacterium]|nr:hypothetical protein [Thermoleophilaceae bacterium]